MGKTKYVYTKATFAIIGQSKFQKRCREQFSLEKKHASKMPEDSVHFDMILRVEAGGLTVAQVYEISLKNEKKLTRKTKNEIFKILRIT